MTDEEKEKYRDGLIATCKVYCHIDYDDDIHVVDGKKMVRTIGDLYLSGESEHVQFEQL